MPGVRLSARLDIKKCLDKIYFCISNDEPLTALNGLEKLQMHVVKYYNTRNMDSHRFDSIFSSVRRLLERYQSNPRTREKLYDYLFEFDKEMGRGRFSKEETNDPITALKMAYADLKEDYMDFKPGTGQIEKNEESKDVLELLKDDLMELTSLEPSFKSLNDDVAYTRFNKMCKQADACLSQIPPISQGPIASNRLTKFVKAVESLFTAIVDVIVPTKEITQDVEKTDESTVADKLVEFEETLTILKEEFDTFVESKSQPSTPS